MRDVSEEVHKYHSGAEKSENAQRVYSGFIKGDLTLDSAFEAFNRKPYYISEDSKNAYCRRKSNDSK